MRTTNTAAVAATRAPAVRLCQLEVIQSIYPKPNNVPNWNTSSDAR